MSAGRRAGRCQGGFTLIELMICVAIAGTVATALGAFYLQHLSLARAVSIDREMERTGRLVLDRLRRDARVAGQVSAGAGTLTLEGEQRRVTYRLQEGALVRTAQPAEAGKPSTRDIYPRVHSFRSTPSGRALELRITLVANLAVVVRRREISATLLLETPSPQETP